MENLSKNHPVLSKTVSNKLAKLLPVILLAGLGLNSTPTYSMERSTLFSPNFTWERANKTEKAVVIIGAVMIVGSICSHFYEIYKENKKNEATARAKLEQEKKEVDDLIKALDCQLKITSSTREELDKLTSQGRICKDLAKCSDAASFTTTRSDHK